jgi:phosphate transport system substrate-binding protein
MHLASRSLAPIAAVALGLLPSCKTTSDTPLTYQGSSTIGLSVLPELVSSFEKSSGIRFTTMDVEGSNKGFSAVMRGQAAIGGLSRALAPAEKARNPYMAIIGYDALTIFVNDSNPVRNLTHQQAADIFSGKIKSWSEVGGPATPVTSFLESAKHGTALFVQEAVLAGGEAKPTRTFEIPSECVHEVSLQPGGVTAEASYLVESHTHAVSIDGIAPDAQNVRSGKYPLARPLILIAKNPPDDNAKKFIDWVLTPEGQAIVKTKFVPAVLQG